MFSDVKFDEIPVLFRELVQVLEQMPAGVAIAEAPSGRIMFHNQAAEELVRHAMLPVSDFSGYAQYGAIHEDGRPYAPEEYPIARALTGQAVHREEVKYVRGDGTLTWFLTNAAAVKDDSGKVIKAVATFVDISEQKSAREELGLSQMRLIEALRGGDLILWDLDFRSERIEHTGETLRLLGYRPAEMPSDLNGWLHLVHPDDRALYADCVSRHAYRHSPGMEVEYRLQAAGGAWRWFLTRGKGRRFDEGGRALHMAGSHLDITGRKQSELLLRDTETKLRLAIETAELGFWEWDIRANEVYFSQQWKRQLGYQDGEVMHRIEEWESRIHPSERQQVLERVRTYLNDSRSDFALEFRFRHRDGSYRWIDARAQVVRNEQGKPLKMIGTHIDITERKEREEQVRLVAQHDRLTNLPNRALILEEAERWQAAALRQGKMFATLFIDLDNFKPINDNYGHHIGDEMLKQVAMRLKSSFRSHDIVGRIGGDEFLVIVTQLDNALSAAHAAAHALHELSLPYRIGDLRLHTSPSIGISMFPHDGTDIETLMRHADAAMYEAKQGGKGAYRFFTRGQTSLPDSAKMETSLRESFAHDDLQIVFQPIINTHTRRLVAAEALLRWRLPGGTDVPPEIFIPLAEQCGLIVAMGNWVLRKSFEQHRMWCEQGLPPIPIGVNLSAIQFRETDLIAGIMHGMEENRIDPGYLSVEISDRVFTGNLEYATPILRKLKALGIWITLDDFGAGYSSLEKLSLLPIDRVKIDRSLITSLPHNKTSIAITEAAITFGNLMNIEVIAEGLESAQVQAFLEQRHCHCAQGFHLARPMPGAEFARWYMQAGLH